MLYQLPGCSGHASVMNWPGVRTWPRSSKSTINCASPRVTPPFSATLEILPISAVETWLFSHIPLLAIADLISLRTSRSPMTFSLSTPRFDRQEATQNSYAHLIAWNEGRLLTFDAGCPKGAEGLSRRAQEERTIWSMLVAKPRASLS